MAVSGLHILVVTGASGAGKTAVVQELEKRGMPGVRFFYFDSIGVPSADVMERDFGGGEAWQAWATHAWLAQLGASPPGVRVVILDGQTRPSVVFSAAKRAAPRETHVVLLDCSPEVRAARLRGPRSQPELVTPRMDSWAAYLRGQADALGLPVIDTTELSVAQAADAVQALCERLLGNGD
jgi:hypothetical protein